MITKDLLIFKLLSRSILLNFSNQIRETRVFIDLVLNLSYVMINIVGNLENLEKP